LIYLFQVSVRYEESEELVPVYLFYKPQDAPLELRKSIDSILRKIREKGESPIYDRIYLAEELNRFFDKIKILMLGIPFEPQKLEGTGIQVLVFRIPELIRGVMIHILAIADSEDSPIAVRRIIKYILNKNRHLIERLISLAKDKRAKEFFDKALDIYNELDFKVSEMFRARIRRLPWAERASLSAAIFGTVAGLASMLLLTALVLWLDSIYGFLQGNRDLVVMLGTLIIIATSFFTGFVTGWSRWIKLSAPIVSIVGTIIFMNTLFAQYLAQAISILGLSIVTFSMLIVMILAATALIVYFLSFIFGYYLVETRVLTPPKMRIVEKPAMRGLMWKLKAFIRRLT